MEAIGAHGKGLTRNFEELVAGYRRGLRRRSGSWVRRGRRMRCERARRAAKGIEASLSNIEA